ncbi:MAG: Short-chain dehydrogenase [Friedmanniella sp.]|nr:Short-chain dehydrogenase [Friedmanniella sp.]
MRRPYAGPGTLGPMTSPSLAPSDRPLALVAGASRGLGLLVARELGARGHRLVICARDAAELGRAEAMLGGLGYEVSTQVCDVADEAAVHALVDGVEDRLGPIEVAVVVAGVIQVGPLESLTRAHFEQAIDIMLWGPINVGLAVTARMRPRGRGRIGVVSSVGGLISVPHLLPYSTAKFGAVGFASGLRAELAGSGVKVTTITPGLMRTGSHLRAQFVGRQGAEFGWFSLGASLPLVSMDAEVAAARIVEGVLAGRAYVVLTPLAKIGMRLNGLAPGLTAGIMGTMSRLLPAPPRDGETGTVEGYEAEAMLKPGSRRVLGGLTTLGRRAAAAWNERPRP